MSKNDPQKCEYLIDNSYCKAIDDISEGTAIRKKGDAQKNRNYAAICVLVKIPAKSVATIWTKVKIRHLIQANHLEVLTERPRNAKKESKDLQFF